jgi:hypothetical protein
MQADANDIAALAAGRATFHPLPEHGRISFEQQHLLERTLPFNQHPIQSFGLTEGPRVPVKNKAGTLLRAEPIPDERVNNRVPDEFTRSGQLFRFRAEFRARRLFGPEQTAWRNDGQIELTLQSIRNRSLSRRWRAK